MANFNKVILAGNLTRDPQLSYLPSQTPIVEFGMAINRKWRGQDGQTREETCFVDCTIFGKPAETFNQYMSKGRPVLIEGRLKFDSWEKDGQKRSKLRVVVDSFQFLGSASQGGGAPAGRYQSAPARNAPAPAAAPTPAPAPAPAGSYTPPPQEAPSHDNVPQEPAPPQYDNQTAEGGGGDDIPF